MAFFQIQESPSVFINTDYIERFQYTDEGEPSGGGTLTIHFVSGETVTFSGEQGAAGYESLIEVLGDEAQDEE